MADSFIKFERIARAANRFAYAEVATTYIEHPFDHRNIHPSLPKSVRKLFDDGHYAQSTFEAFKFVDREVARLAECSESGFKLMMKAFAETSPMLKLTLCNTNSEKDEQKGFQFLFAGSILAIRNPRGHEHSVNDSPDECLDYLALASTLLRRIETAGFALNGLTSG